jgi:hypothetical protein
MSTSRVAHDASVAEILAALGTGRDTSPRFAQGGVWPFPDSPLNPE